MTMQFKKLLLTAYAVIALVLAVASVLLWRTSPPAVFDGVDIPAGIKIGEEDVSVSWTDENTGEELIIKSSQKEYSGQGLNTVLFSVTNISASDQDVDIHFLTPSLEWDILNIKRFIQNEVTVIPSKVVSFTHSTTTGKTTDTIIPQKTVTDALWEDKVAIEKSIDFEGRKDSQGNMDKKAFTQFIKSGETLYFQADVQFPPTDIQALPLNQRLATREFVTGEFFIEAFGSKGSYGHLDPTTLTDNLLAYWKLDESSGDAIDSSGGGFTLTNNGGIAYSAGKINNGMHGDSGFGTDFLGRTDILGRTGGNNGAITISLWAKLDDWSVGNATLFNIDDGNTSPYIQWTIQNNATQILFNRGRMCVANNVLTDTTTNSTGTWYHYVVTWDGTNRIIYQNAATDTTDATAAGNGDACGDEVTRIANLQGGSNPPHGVVDEVGVWNRALTADEVTELYNGGDGIQHPFAVAAVAGLDFGFVGDF